MCGDGDDDDDDDQDDFKDILLFENHQEQFQKSRRTPQT